MSLPLSVHVLDSIFSQGLGSFLLVSLPPDLLLASCYKTTKLPHNSRGLTHDKSYLYFLLSYLEVLLRSSFLAPQLVRPAAFPGKLFLAQCSMV